MSHINSQSQILALAFRKRLPTHCSLFARKRKTLFLLRKNVGTRGNQREQQRRCSLFKKTWEQDGIRGNNKNVVPSSPKRGNKTKPEGATQTLFPLRSEAEDRHPLEREREREREERREGERERRQCPGEARREPPALRARLNPFFSSRGFH